MAYPDPYYGNSPGTSYYGGQQQMAFGVDDGLAIGSGLFQGIGGVLGQDKSQELGLQKYLSALELAERIREFNRSQGLNEGQTAVNLQNDMNRAPMRDQLYYTLSARMGLPQQSFNYNTQGAGPGVQAGVPNLAGMYNDKLAQYRPGMGGVNTDVSRQLLGQLGYGGGAGGSGGNPLLGSSMPHPQGQKINDYVSDYLKNFLSGGSAAPAGNPAQTTPYTPGATGGTGTPTPKQVAAKKTAKTKVGKNQQIAGNL